MSKTKVHTVYKIADGTRVPGSTTIIGILDKPALLGWAWKLGLAGEDYNKVRDKAADIGTIAHYLAECEMKGETPDLSDYAPANVEVAENSFIAFLDFVKNNKIKAIHNEIALVSEAYRFGGTIDIYAEMGEEKKKVLIDIKTSSGVYPEMRLQVASYKNLMLEHGFQVDSVHIVRIDKVTGTFEHHRLGELDVEWEMFKALLPVYNLKKIVYKR